MSELPLYMAAVVVAVKASLSIACFLASAYQAPNVEMVSCGIVSPCPDPEVSVVVQSAPLQGCFEFIQEPVPPPRTT